MFSKDHTLGATITKKINKKLNYIKKKINNNRNIFKNLWPLTFRNWKCRMTLLHFTPLLASPFKKLLVIETAKYYEDTHLFSRLNLSFLYYITGSVFCAVSLRRGCQSEESLWLTNYSNHHTCPLSLPVARALSI